MMNRIYFVSALLAVVLAIMVASCGKKKVDIITLPDSEVTAPLDSLFSSLFADDEPGAVVGVMRKGEPVYLRGFGLADLSTAAPFTDSSQINVSSVTKLMVTAAIMKLVANGKVSLDESVSPYFPQFSPIFDSITVRHILSHTSGLPDKRPRNPDEWATYIKKHDTTFGLNDDYMLYGRESEMVRFFETVDTLDAVPGTTFRYQDTPFMLLSKVIKIAAGMPFEKYMRDSIFEPAGMKHTFFFDPEATIPNEVHAYAPSDSDDPAEVVYNSSNGKWEEYDYGEAAFFPTRADRGAYTTPGDMFRWLKYYFGGHVISEKQMRELFSWHASTKMADVGYGLGLFLENKANGNEVCGFNMGYNGGFSAFAMYYPESQTHFFIFSNRPDWNRLKIGRTVDKIVREAFREDNLLN